MRDARMSTLIAATQLLTDKSIRKKDTPMPLYHAFIKKYGIVSQKIFYHIFREIAIIWPKFSVKSAV